MTFRNPILKATQSPRLLPALALSLAMAVAFGVPAMAGEGRVATQQADNDSITGKDSHDTMITPVTLRERVVVSGRHVRLGDLFEGAGDKAGMIVGYSPDPGKRGTFDVNWLFRVARAHQLNWQPVSSRQQAVVTRKSVTIERQEIEDHILSALIEKGVPADMNVELSNRMLRLYVDGDSTATVAVEDVIYDARSKRFTAIILAPADDPAPTRTRVTGRIIKMVNVPVITRRLIRGDIIRESDINWVRVNSAQLQRDIIMDSADLIGKTPTRGLPTHSPIQLSDVRRPVLVDKGSLVTMLLKTPYMVLTAQGRANEEGSEGDAIAITNLQSNKVIHAIVTGSGQVKITSTGNLAMN